MSTQAEHRIVRVADIPWEDRVNVDGWPSRAGLYWDDRADELCMRLIDYPVGSIEPRHVHAGSHATTVLKGRAIVDRLTLGPLDVVLGPSNEAHGPLAYPDGCKLFSIFHGSYYHSEVQKLSAEKNYRLIQAGQIPWQQGGAPGCEMKTLVDRGVGRLLLEARRFSPGARLGPERSAPLSAALVVEGSAVIGQETLKTWDFVFAPAGGGLGTVDFPNGATLLTVTLQ